MPPVAAAASSPPRLPSLSSYLLAALTLAASFFTSTTLGAGWYLSTRTDVTTDLLPWLGPETVRRVWSDPELILLGVSFSGPLLFILLCHELGHFLVCLRYRVPATPPYFLPAPLALGTFGAFIRIKAPIHDKRQLLDIGAGGPIAGFVALLPFLVYGVAKSTPVIVFPALPTEPATGILLVPGKCLAMWLTTHAIHGPLPPSGILDLHPFALAAWVGLLATALNLLPVGQLDGGHILYAATGPLQRRLALPLWGLLVAAGVFVWQGWLLWSLIVLIMGLRHPPVRDERQPLDPRRRAVALVCLLLLVLCFVPIPVDDVFVVD